MDKKISASVENVLMRIARHTNDLFSDKALDIIEKKSNRTTHWRKSKRKPSTSALLNLEELKSQIPDGQFTRIGEIKRLILQIKERNEVKSITYSPLNLHYSEFNCCKVMKYNNGHIITGRDREIESILLTLCKKSKRGVILTGEAGTGKTAIVRAINNKLIENVVPRQLIGCRIYNMDIPLIFSKYKSDPIGAITSVLERASQYDKAILFIDEVHQLLGQRLNDIMKPYLTEQIRFIGSTTVDEYHTIITNDQALERRFTQIHVSEPTIKQTINMMEGTKSIFEQHHKCIIPDKICEYAVVNGSRFLGHRRNPDKSLDVLDIACANMYEKEIKNEQQNPKEQDYFKALEERKEILSSYKLIPGQRKLTEEYVDMAISSITGINYSEIRNSLDYEKTINRISKNIFGQLDAIKSIANVVNIFKHVSYDRLRPISILLLVGPAGTGKASCAKLLAESLFGGTENLIDYDMSAFKRSFQLTELKGAPPGYVGYSRSGGMVKKIRNNPQSVLLLRKANYAHPDIKSFIMNSCKSGKMIDSAERQASLNNMIIILSVTLDKNEEQKVFGNKSVSMGFGVTKNTDTKYNQEELEKIIGKEIINEVDETVIFNKLTSDDLELIYHHNVNYFLEMYNVDIDHEKLKDKVLKSSRNGHDIISKLTCEVPKMVFNQLKKE